MVEATFSAATGPQTHVTGTSGRLSPVTEVWANRLMPCGWKSAVEKNGFWPWDKAVAGHWKNQRKRAGAQQPHRVWVLAPSAQACTHRRKPRARYNAPATARVIHVRHPRADFGACLASFECACR